MKTFQILKTPTDIEDSRDIENTADTEDIDNKNIKDTGETA